MIYYLNQCQKSPSRVPISFASKFRGPGTVENRPPGESTSSSRLPRLDIARRLWLYIKSGRVLLQVPYNFPFSHRSQCPHTPGGTPGGPTSWMPLPWRLGAAVAEKVPLLATYHRIQALDELPGWIEEAITDGEKELIGRLELGSRRVLAVTKEYECYSGDVKSVKPGLWEKGTGWLRRLRRM